MPQTPERKREYQRQRRQTKTVETGTNDTSEAALGQDFGGEHYWGAVSKAPEGKRICTAFEFQGRMIGGCGEIRDWPFRSEPSLAMAIIDSDHFREIQSKMPVTPGRR